MKKRMFILLLLALSTSSLSGSFVQAEGQQLASNASVQLTLSQAQQWARSNNFSLKEAQQTIDRNRINLKNAGKNLDFIPAGTVQVMEKRMRTVVQHGRGMPHRRFLIWNPKSKSSLPKIRQTTLQ
ncbi:hypothetical protein GMA19_04178 [Paenibacillus polymyxa E681]|uniref:hypothetical protein n=1 Tax=Paenibacillus polymyxa TaxID=1406 RepID=UPI0001E31AE5|nr:hypothetical protein [Paenibacillus polymyxa]QNV58973.1 hypothetical protein GE561_04180 [Paenibacillus polymyxa E681]QNV63808.1 hypothetical protein GMA19_04178 [Paenibacillus polymyxa E681]